jgi:cell division protein FtsX
MHSAALSLEWSDEAIYMVFQLITAMLLGFAGAIVIGSIWGFSIMFGLTMAVAATTPAMPAWIGALGVGFAVLFGFVWSHA